MKPTYEELLEFVKLAAEPRKYDGYFTHTRPRLQEIASYLLKPPQSFPCIKKWVRGSDQRLVVMFTSSNTGILLHGVSTVEIGQEGRGWIEASSPNWVDYKIGDPL
jgi:hypothetical protein